MLVVRLKFSLNQFCHCKPNAALARDIFTSETSLQLRLSSFFSFVLRLSGSGMCCNIGSIVVFIALLNIMVLTSFCYFHLRSFCAVSVWVYGLWDSYCSFQ